MIKAAGEGSEKVSNIVEIIEAEREIFQEDEQFVDKKSSGKQLKGGGSSHYARGGYQPMPRGYQTFRGPVKLPSCRICKVLESRGDTLNLYENHVGNYATGCPRYIGLTTEERFEITKEAKICLRCLDPKSTWVFRDGHKGCTVNKNKKNRFSCTNTNCSWHSWICHSHKDENKAVLDKFQSDLAKKGLTFVFLNAPATDSQALKAKQRPNSREGAAPDLSPVIPVRDTSKDLTREQAVEKLRKLTPNNVELDAEPKGSPMFMFGYAEGKTRPVLMMYDTGCSDLLLKEGVPGKEIPGVIQKCTILYITQNATLKNSAKNPPCV